MTICTIDVHSRDVVSKMILNKIESSFAFMWQSQLRHRSLPTPGRPAGENKKVVDIDLNQFCNWCKNFLIVVKGGTRQRRIALPTSVTPSSATGTSTSEIPRDL